MTQFLPDSPKKVMTQEKCHILRSGDYTSAALLHSPLQISFPDQLNSSQPTRGVRGHQVILLSTRLASHLVGAQVPLGCERELRAVLG